MNKKFIFGTIAAALAFLGVSRAAIDDDGMSYVSASEGLSGSIRIRFFDDTDDPDRKRRGNEDQPEVNFGDSRLSYRGESDMGSGLAITYYLEIRPKHDVSASDSNYNELQIEYLDAGVRGFFGHFRVGNIESASSAIVPSADRSNDVGTTGFKLANDYDLGGIRWVSPEIRGVQVGLSAAMEDFQSSTQAEAEKDRTFDQYDVAVIYNFQGMDIGGSYSVKNPDLSKNEGGENGKGFRVGVNYERDNWGVGYNYHKYDAYVQEELEILSGVNESGGTVGRLHLVGHRDTQQEEHVFGANFSFSRLNLAVSHSMVNVVNEVDLNDTFAEGKTDLEFKKTALDIAYKLGSKSQVVAAYTLEEDNSNYDKSIDKTKGYYIMLRTDF